MTTTIDRGSWWENTVQRAEARLEAEARKALVDLEIAQLTLRKMKEQPVTSQSQEEK